MRKGVHSVFLDLILGKQSVIQQNTNQSILTEIHQLQQKQVEEQSKQNKDPKYESKFTENDEQKLQQLRKQYAESDKTMVDYYQIKDRIESFNLKMMMGNIPAECELVLYDDTAIEAEYTLSQMSSGSLPMLRGALGYVGEEANALKFNLTVQGYSLEFTNKGTRLALKCVPDSFKSNNQQKEIYTGNISDIVQQVASKAGWVIDKIVPTKLLYNEDNDPPYEKYPCAGKDYWSFLQDLASQAITEDGKTPFRCYFSSLEEPKHIIFEPYPDKEDMEKELYNAKRYDFTVNSVSDTVISFTPQTDINSMMLLGAAKVDTTTNQGNEETTTVAGKDNQSTIKVDCISGSWSQDVVEQMARSVYNKAKKGAITADLEILGDPQLRPGMSVSVGVYLPYGGIHHSSGVYKIISITHNLQQGSYTCTATLQKGQSSSNINTASSHGGNQTLTSTSQEQVYDNSLTRHNNGVKPSDIAESMVGTTFPPNSCALSTGMMLAGTDFDTVQHPELVNCDNWVQRASEKGIYEPISRTDISSALSNCNDGDTVVFSDSSDSNVHVGLVGLDSNGNKVVYHQSASSGYTIIKATPEQLGNAWWISGVCRTGK